jgi:hypothetical protein
MSGTCPPPLSGRDRDSSGGVPREGRAA